MPVVLIVDDSPADQNLIREYIQSEAMDWIVEFSDTAEEAIVRLEQLAVDVVVTDMRMPGMSGLELLDHIQSSHPHVPVVLITEHDNETMAAEALDRGAASYVAKRELSTRLIEVLKQMIQVTGLQRGFDVLFQRVDEMSFQLSIENDPRLIAPLVNALDLLALRMQLCDRGGRQRIGVALDEALLNAMYHGNLELPADELVNARSELRSGSIPAAVSVRCETPPYSERRIHIHASFTTERLQIAVRDEGSGYPESIRSKGTQGQGRDGHQGLVVIHHTMDEVTFNTAGNEIVMTKHRTEMPPNEALSIE